MLKTSHAFIEKNEDKQKKPCTAILKLLNDAQRTYGNMHDLDLTKLDCKRVVTINHCQIIRASDNHYHHIIIYPHKTKLKVLITRGRVSWNPS